MSHEPATYFNSMSPAWCAKRRKDIQAHVNLQADATVAEQRTMLIELLSQLSSTEAQLAAAEAQATELLARATRAEAKAAGLLVELGEQEAEKLALVLEIQGLRNANFGLEHRAKCNAPQVVDTVTDVTGCIGWVERFTAGEGITKFFGRNLQRTATGPARLSFVEAAHDVRQWFKGQPVSYQQEAVVPLLPRNMSVAAYEAQKELTAS